MFNTRVDWGYHTEPQAGCRGRRIFWPRGKMLGGSGSLNAMIYIRGVASDYDGWAAQGCPEWGWAQVLPAFLASEDNARHPAGPITARAARCLSARPPTATRWRRRGWPPPGGGPAGE
ncbi:GMC family oxidoreductase N-terminal domain-containing protein [Pseudoroseomonas cervicalis]|uniref:GMC family oxidoreductase N-terminal domain-containing protein n=1 Tax=Teichococcus cervicalis TaxID=204525 RepID=UPI0035F010EA